MLTGLRIDVDTLRGAQQGVPRLLDLLKREKIKATFFFSVGPDNMGRHLWRLFKPAFLWKMLRTNAPILYGWNILRCGVVGCGPDIGRNVIEIIHRTVAEGHEVGLHAWDHHKWQSMNMDKPGAVTQEIRLGFERLAEILGTEPLSSAAPAWRAPAVVLTAKRAFPFLYNSDCRGTDCYLPILPDQTEAQPQIPVTLPTYDEMIGLYGTTDTNYNHRLLDLFRPKELNILCLHAEVEGLAKAALFDNFLQQAWRRDLTFTRLDKIFAAQGKLKSAALEIRSSLGREGQMAFQGAWS